jgi:hypothetical protein
VLVDARGPGGGAGRGDHSPRTVAGTDRGGGERDEPRRDHHHGRGTSGTSAAGTVDEHDGNVAGHSGDHRAGTDHDVDDAHDAHDSHDSHHHHNAAPTDAHPLHHRGAHR